MKGSCLCGAVTVTVPGAPEYMNACDCTACFKLGSLTAYYPPDEVAIEGEVRAFVRSDIPAWIEFLFCPACSAAIGWTALEPLDPPRMGVSMRLFDPDDLIGVEVRFPNGREDDGEGDRPPPRHAPVPFGSGTPF